MTVTGRMRKTTGRSIAISRRPPSSMRAARDRSRWSRAWSCRTEARGEPRSIAVVRVRLRRVRAGDSVRSTRSARARTEGGPGSEGQLCAEGASRAPGDALDGGGDRLAGSHREREEFGAVGHGGVDRALPGAGTHGEEAVHAGDPEEGADERAGAQGNERGSQGGCVAHGNEGTCGDEACHPRDRLAQPEDGHVRVHTGQGEPAGDGFAGGSQGIEG